MPTTDLPLRQLFMSLFIKCPSTNEKEARLWLPWNSLRLRQSRPEVEADTAGRGGRPVVLRGLGAGELLSEEREGQDHDACGM